MFHTGTNSQGYVLNSAQLLMASATGNPSGFLVSVYSVSSLAPQNNLGNLNGLTNPALAGNYTYTNAGLFLAPDTTYCLVVSSATALNQGAFNWNAESQSSGLPNGYGWASGLFDTSTDGVNWTYYRGETFQFAVSATAVPEPSAGWLALLGTGILLYACRRV